MSALTEDLIAICTGILGGIILGLSIGKIIGQSNGVSIMEKQAVHYGHAEWVNDKDGAPQFKWKVIKQ